MDLIHSCLLQEFVWVVVLRYEICGDLVASMIWFGSQSSGLICDWFIMSLSQEQAAISLSQYPSQNLSSLVFLA